MAAKKAWKSDKTKAQINEDRQVKIGEIMASAAKKIVGIIESGQSLAWKKSWGGSALFDMPHNPATGHRFSGFNRWLLLIDMMDKDSGDTRFMTFKQVDVFNKANETDCKIKKGAKATHILKRIIFNKKVEGQADDTAGALKDEGDGETRKIVFFQSYPVFHASQIEGLPPMPELAPPNWDKDTLIDGLITASGAQLRHGGDRAFFRPSHDFIQLPAPGDFTGKDKYYATLLHEWYHWTGHQDREAREFGGSFGDEKYALEEIRAESFSVMSGMALGLPVELDDHAAYLQSWSSKLETKEGVKEIVRGMRAASDMLDVVLEFKSSGKPAIEWWPEEAPSVVETETEAESESPSP